MMMEMEDGRARREERERVGGAEWLVGGWCVDCLSGGGGARARATGTGKERPGGVREMR